MSLQRLAIIAEFCWLAVAVGAHGAVLAFCLADHAAGGTPVGMLAAEILRFVQLAILPLWLVLGPGSKWLRWIAVPAFFGLLFLWSDLPYPAAGTQSYWLGLESAGMLMVLAFAVRLGGSRMLSMAGQPPLPPIQFSIRGLLFTTTMVALLVMGGKWIYGHVQAVTSDNQPDIRDLDPLVARTAVAFGLALISFAAWWAVFRPRRVWWTCLLVAGGSAGCGMMMTLLLHESEAWLSFGVWWLLHTLAIMATLAPMRQVGFRLVPMSIKPTPTTFCAIEKMKTYGAEKTFSGVSS